MDQPGCQDVSVIWRFMPMMKYITICARRVFASRVTDTGRKLRPGLQRTEYGICLEATHIDAIASLPHISAVPTPSVAWQSPAKARTETPR
jgi:hypothetical protein